MHAPALTSVSGAVRGALEAGVAVVTEGSRRNARDAIQRRAEDVRAADLLLASLLPAPRPSNNAAARPARGVPLRTA